MSLFGFPMRLIIRLHSKIKDLEGTLNLMGRTLGPQSIKMSIETEEEEDIRKEDGSSGVDCDDVVEEVDDDAAVVVTVSGANSAEDAKTTNSLVRQNEIADHC